jgi:uncharacterized protein (UPF0332 family)
VAIDHTEFLDFAKSLPQQGEINYRNAMSRAYYAAYHLCLLKFPISPTEKGGSHERLIKTLEKSFDARKRSIGKNLRQLRGNRVKADYKLTFSVTNNDREVSILQAEKLIQKIDVLFNAPSLVKPSKLG